MKPRIAFDLDETLGIPMINENRIVGFHIREGCLELLDKLQQSYCLILWSVSSRNYLQKTLSYGLAKYFSETYSWDELPGKWKDIRKIKVSYLIDDSSHHKEEAKRFGIEDGYIVVAAYGSIEDQRNPLLWVHQVEEKLAI